MDAPVGGDALNINYKNCLKNMGVPLNKQTSLHFTDTLTVYLHQKELFIWDRKNVRRCI